MSNLDHDLKDWGARTRPEPADRDALKSSIMDGVRQARPEAPQPKPFPTRLIVQAAAAVILVGFGVVIGLRMQDPSTPNIKPDPGLAGLSKADLDELRTVADELDRLFPEGLRWIAKSNGNVSFQPAEIRRVNESSDRRVLLVYNVLEQQTDGSWKRVARQDIITWSNEPVELEKSKSTLWCHVTDDKHVAINLDLQLDAAGESLRITDDTIQEIGSQLTVLEEDLGNRKVKVVQTAYQI